MSSRPRLVHLTTTDVSLALLLGPQLSAFAQAGYEVIGVSAAGPWVEQLRDAGIGHVPLRHATRSAAPHRDALALAELRSLFRRLRPDIVHTHNPKPGVYGRLAARAAKVPAVVNTVHGLYAVPGDRVAKRALVYGLERLASSCSHAELVQNPEDLDTLRRIGVPRSKLVLLGNGVDLARFDPTRFGEADRTQARAELGLGPRDVVVGAVGRLVWEKGYRELFAAARRVQASAPAARFFVAGPRDPEKADAVPEAALDQASRDGVSILGLRLDVDRLYAAMDLYVLASHREGYPRSAMEAAAMGLPVVATDIRGCREVVVDGLTGTLVPPGDVGALATAVVELAADAGLRRRMGTAARERARRHFDQQRVIDLTLAVYDDLRSGRPIVPAS